MINSSSGQGPLPIHFVVVNNDKQIYQVVDGNAVSTVGIKVNESPEATQLWLQALTQAASARVGALTFRDFRLPVLAIKSVGAGTMPGWSNHSKAANVVVVSTAFR